jgi:hypothetical protein
MPMLTNRNEKAAAGSIPATALFSSRILGDQRDDNEEYTLDWKENEALAMPQLWRPLPHRFQIRVLRPVSELRIRVDSYPKGAGPFEADAVRLPPFGKEFQRVPKTGIRVVIGPGAWDFAKGHHCPIMVLPEGEPASNFTWPSDGGPALVYERGEAKGDYQAKERLTELSRELLIAGASSVVAIREADLDHDPRVFFDREVSDVAA